MGSENYAFDIKEDYKFNRYSKHSPTIRTTQIDTQDSDPGFKRRFDSKTPDQKHDIDDVDTENAEKKVSIIKKAKKICGMIISNLGLVSVVLGYLVMGGYLFEYLEVGNEKSGCKEKQDLYLEKWQEASDRVYNVAQHPNKTYSQLEIHTLINEFADTVYSLSLNPTINCSLLGDPDNWPAWNLPNSIYFCATILTTIGYGHISPTTQWGQIVCIIYSILGIPIMLIFLGKIGEPMALMFRTFYLNIICCKCFLKDKKVDGDNGDNGDKRDNDLDILNDKENGLQPSFVKENGQRNGNKGSENWDGLNNNNYNLEEGGKPPAKVIEVVEDEEEENLEPEIVNIPITVTLLLLMAYIFIGAMLFKIWEKDWTLVEAVYFSFITLSTIGFGDYVPGRDGPFNNISIQLELLIGSIYCMVGLALLAMCINLIQDEISSKFTWISIKLGLNKDENDNKKEEDEFETSSEEEETSSEEDSSTDDEDKDKKSDSKSRKTTKSATKSSATSSRKLAKESFA